MALFVIMHEHRDPETDAPLFWNNANGWVDLQSATVFSDEDKWNLPMESWGVLNLPSAVSKKVRIRRPERSYIRWTEEEDAYLRQQYELPFQQCATQSEMGKHLKRPKSSIPKRAKKLGLYYNYSE